MNSKEVKESTGKIGNRQFLSGCGSRQNIAPPSLSRDNRIKMFARAQPGGVKGAKAPPPP